MSIRRVWLGIYGLFLPIGVFSQTQDSIAWSLDDQGVAFNVEEVNEAFQKVDLNQSNLQELLKLSFMTPLDIAAIQKHKTKYGPFLHVLELDLVEDITPEKREILQKYIVVNTPNFSLSKPLRTQHVLSYRIKRNAMLNDQVNHHSWNEVVRYQAKMGDQFKWGGMMSKDVGEDWKLPQYLFKTAHFQWNSSNKRWGFLLGDYVVHWAQGSLMNGSFLSRPSWPLASLIRPPAFIKPYTSTIENNNRRGIVIQYRNKNQFILLGYSRLWLHGSLDSLNGWNEISNTVFDDSLSRTKWRMAKRSQCFLMYQRQWQHHEWGVGVLQDTIAQEDVLLVKGNRQYSFSWNHQKNSHHYFTETVFKDGGIICHVGGLISLHPKMRFGGLLNVRKSCSGVSEESSYRLQWEWQISDVGTFLFGLNKTKGGASDEKIASPSGQCFMQFNFIPKRSFLFYYRFLYQSDGEIMADGQMYNWSSYHRCLHRLDANLKFHSDWSLHWRYDGLRDSRFTIMTQYSFLELDFHPLMKPLSVVARYTFFDAPLWDMRLYAQERGVSGTYYIPVLYGVGQRMYLLSTLKTEMINYQLKVGFIQSIPFNKSNTFNEFGIIFPFQTLEMKLTFNF